MEIGFLGVDTLGFKIASRLLAEGHQVKVCDSNLSLAVLELERQGAMLVSEAQELGQSELIVSMIPHSQDLENHLYGERGLFKNLRFESLHICVGNLSETLRQQLELDHALVDTSFISVPFLEDAVVVQSVMQLNDNEPSLYQRFQFICEAAFKSPALFYH